MNNDDSAATAAETRSKRVEMILRGGDAVVAAERCLRCVREEDEP